MELIQLCLSGVHCCFQLLGDQRNIDFQTSNFANFEQFTVDVYFANFEQVEIHPICSFFPTLGKA